MSLILAKTFGICLLFLGFGLVRNPERFQSWDKSILDEDRRHLFAGFISLLIGSFILSVHNVWISGWQVILTILGYLAVSFGAGCMVSEKFFGFFRPMINYSSQLYRILGIVLIFLGALLCYRGF